MPIGDPKYTAAQRDAIELHYVDRNRTAPEVARAAAAGEITGRDGEPLEPFEIPVNTVRDMGRKVRKRRAGRVASPLADRAPRDAIEVLRRRLVNVADAMLADIEKRKPEQADPERLRQIGRCVLELARLPGPTDPRPASPATRDEHGKQQSREGGTLAGPLLRAHRKGALEPAQTETEHGRQQHTTDDGEHSATHTSGIVQTDNTSARPGAWGSEQASALPG